MNKIKIVCDSLSDVTDQQIEKYDIEFIPLNIIIGDFTGYVRRFL